MHQLIHELFLNHKLGEICIKELGEVFAHVHSPMNRVSQLVEIISELREPEQPLPKKIPETPVTPASAIMSPEEERKMKFKVILLFFFSLFISLIPFQMAQIRVKINQVKDELEDCVRSLNLERAQELKIELEELEERHENLSKTAAKTPQSKSFNENAEEPFSLPEEDDEEPKLLNDPTTLTRCLLILCEVMSKTDITIFTTMLRSMHDNLIVPCLKSEVG